MRHEGAKTGFISKCLDLLGNTVTNYLNRFQPGKLPATLEDRYYKPTSSPDPFPACLRRSFCACPVVVDAARFVLGAFLGLRWCFQRVFLKTSPGRQRYNIPGAIGSHNPANGCFRTHPQ